ncbi:hypothetical protein [Actinopolyspora mortivallis]|uniref:hypothetical protein n=1 Tax=Actinopolyspora mortivallis TaxID=33906 RepID=UPI0011B24569|nr:hypothetical protein [Actinopolyspora mortivallis]
MPKHHISPATSASTAMHDLQQQYERWKIITSTLRPPEQTEHTLALTHAIDHVLRESTGETDLPEVLRCALAAWRDRLQTEIETVRRVYATSNTPPCRERIQPH